VPEDGLEQHLVHLGVVAVGVQRVCHDGLEHVQLVGLRRISSVEVCLELHALGGCCEAQELPVEILAPQRDLDGLAQEVAGPVVALTVGAGVAAEHVRHLQPPGELQCDDGVQHVLILEVQRHQQLTRVEDRELAVHLLRLHGHEHANGVQDQTLGVAAHPLGVIDADLDGRLLGIELVLDLDDPVVIDADERPLQVVPELVAHVVVRLRGLAGDGHTELDRRIRVEHVVHGHEDPLVEEPLVERGRQEHSVVDDGHQTSFASKGAKRHLWGLLGCIYFTLFYILCQYATLRTHTRELRIAQP